MTTVTCYLMFRWYYGPEFSGKALDAWAFEHGVQIELLVRGRLRIMVTSPVFLYQVKC